MTFDTYQAVFCERKKELGAKLCRQYFDSQLHDINHSIE